jgi:hypothetical protein
MGWVRCHKRYGGFLALAALALQIVLAFGHVHPVHVHVGKANLDGIGSAAAHRAVAPETAAVAQSSRQMPAQNPGDDDDYCAICASIYLASTSLISQPPLLPLPVEFERVVRVFDTADGIVATRRVAFQSRAPPTA